MFKKLICICLLATFNLFIMGLCQKKGPEIAILQTFKYLKVTPEKYVLHHGERTNFSIQQNKMDSFVDSIKESLYLVSLKKQKYSNAEKYTVCGKIYGLDIELTIMNDNLNGNSTHPYLSIQVNGCDRPDLRLVRICELLTKILNENGITPNYHFSIQGSTYMGCINTRESVLKALEQLRATKAESMCEDNITSISAYSPVLPYGFKSRNKLINIQVASNFDPNTKKLTLTIGTPIITIEY